MWLRRIAMNPSDAISWIVVADAGGARIFSSRSGESTLAEVAELHSPEGEGSAARRARISERKPRVLLRRVTHRKTCTVAPINAEPLDVSNQPSATVLTITVSQNRV